jgi:hypothetical protein
MPDRPRTDRLAIITNLHCCRSKCSGAARDDYEAQLDSIRHAGQRTTLHHLALSLIEAEYPPVIGARRQLAAEAAITVAVEGPLAKNLVKLTASPGGELVVLGLALGGGALDHASDLDIGLFTGDFAAQSMRHGPLVRRHFNRLASWSVPRCSFPPLRARASLRSGHAAAATRQTRSAGCVHRRFIKYQSAITRGRGAYGSDRGRVLPGPSLRKEVQAVISERPSATAIHAPRGAGDAKWSSINRAGRWRNRCAADCGHVHFCNCVMPPAQAEETLSASTLT